MVFSSAHLVWLFQLLLPAVAAIMLANTIHTNKHMHTDKDMGGGSVAVQGLQGGQRPLSAQSGALIRNVVSGHSYAEHNCIQSEAGCEPGRGRG